MAKPFVVMAIGRMWRNRRQAIKESKGIWRVISGRALNTLISNFIKMELNSSVNDIMCKSVGWVGGNKPTCLNMCMFIRVTIAALGC